MDYQKWVLESLIDRYEHSESFREEEPKKNIVMYCPSNSSLNAMLQDPNERPKFVKALETLEKEEMVEFSWDGEEDGKKVRKIGLMTKLTSLQNSYKHLGKANKKDTMKELDAMLKAWKADIGEQTPMTRLIDEMRKGLKEQHKLPRFFSEDPKLNREIIQCLKFMEKNREEVSERQLSEQLFGDRLYFENIVRKKVISVLKYVKRKENEETYEDGELLLEKGVTRWPEILEFCGSISMEFEEGETVDYHGCRHGAYINSDMIRGIRRIAMEQIDQIIFIENKANYLWYIKNQKAEKELVVYHGRCLSPTKKQFFRKLYEAGKGNDHQVRYCYWGDIDVEGIRLLAVMKNEVIPELLPYQMDVESLQKWQTKARELPALSYFRKLREMKKDERYVHYWELIEEMHRSNRMLKQEDVIC